ASASSTMPRKRPLHCTARRSKGLKFGRQRHQLEIQQHMACPAASLINTNAASVVSAESSDAPERFVHTEFESLGGLLLQQNFGQNDEYDDEEDYYSGSCTSETVEEMRQSRSSKAVPRCLQVLGPQQQNGIRIGTQRVMPQTGHTEKTDNKQLATLVKTENRQLSMGLPGKVEGQLTQAIQKSTIKISSKQLPRPKFDQKVPETADSTVESGENSLLEFWNPPDGSTTGVSALLKSRYLALGMTKYQRLRKLRRSRKAIFTRNHWQNCAVHRLSNPPDAAVLNRKTNGSGTGRGFARLKSKAPQGLATQYAIEFFREKFPCYADRRISDWTIRNRFRPR
uniref:Fork-head domain-containing protein n=1 Tax=Macrostomum lignano TaxID=282301 RepID=A0A1I8GNB8_9PLAT